MRINISQIKPILIMLIISLLFRLIFAIISFNNNVMVNFADDNAYMEFSNQILEQGPLVLNNDKLSVTARVLGPGLPWLMAFFQIIFPSGWLSIFILNAFIGSITCVLIFLIGSDLISKEVGIFAGLWSAFYVLFLKYIPTAGKEIWMTFLLTSTIFLILKINKRNFIYRNKYLLIMLLATIFSLLIHVDERYLAYFPLIVLILLWFKKGTWFSGLKRSLLFIFIVFVLMIPWLIRNYLVYNNVIILSVRTTKFTQHIFNYKAKDFYRFKIGKFVLDKNEIESVISGGKKEFNFGKKINSKQVNAMKDGIIPHRFSRFESYWSVFQILWKPVDFNRSYSTTGYRYDGVWSWRHNISVGLTYGLLLPFIFWGFVALYRQKRKIAIFLGSIFVYHTLIHMLFIPFTRNRYRIPIDAIVIVLGVYGMLEFFKWMKSRFHRKVT